VVAFLNSFENTVETPLNFSSPKLLFGSFDRGDPTLGIQLKIREKVTMKLKGFAELFLGNPELAISLLNPFVAALEALIPYSRSVVERSIGFFIEMMISDPNRLSVHHYAIGFSAV
jgi:hypothetical protein